MKMSALHIGRKKASGLSSHLFTSVKFAGALSMTRDRLLLVASEDLDQKPISENDRLKGSFKVYYASLLLQQNNVSPSNLSFLTNS